MNSVLKSFKNTVKGVFTVGTRGLQMDYMGAVSNTTNADVKSWEEIRSDLKVMRTKKRSFASLLGVDDEMRDATKEMVGYIRSLGRGEDSYDMYGDEPWDYSDSSFDYVSSSKAKGGINMDSTVTAKATLEGSLGITKALGAIHKDSMMTSRVLNQSLLTELQSNNKVLKDIHSAIMDKDFKEKTYKYYAESLMILKELSMDIKTGFGINPVTGEAEFEDVGAGRFAKKIAQGDVAGVLGDVKNALAGMSDKTGLMPLLKALVVGTIQNYTGEEGMKNLFRSGFTYAGGKIMGSEGRRRAEILLDNPAWFFEEALQRGKVSKNSIWSGIAKRLSNNLDTGNDTTYKSDPRKRMYLDQAMYTAITNNIPDLLAKIYSAISGTPQLKYDYMENKWKTNDEILAEFKRSRPTLLMDSSDFADALGEYFKDSNNSKFRDILMTKDKNGQYSLKGSNLLSKVISAAIDKGIGVNGLENGDIKSIQKLLGIKGLTPETIAIIQEFIKESKKDKDTEKVFSELNKLVMNYKQEWREYVHDYKSNAMYKGTLGLFNDAALMGYIDENDVNLESLMANMNEETRRRFLRLQFGIKDIGFGGGGGSSYYGGTPKRSRRNAKGANGMTPEERRYAEIANKPLSKLNEEERKIYFMGFGSKIYNNIVGLTENAEKKADKELMDGENDEFFKNAAEALGEDPEDLKLKIKAYRYYEATGKVPSYFDRLKEKMAKAADAEVYDLYTKKFNQGKVKSYHDIDLSSISDKEWEEINRYDERDRITKSQFDMFDPINSSIKVMNELYAKDSMRGKIKLAGFAGTTYGLNYMMRSFAGLGPVTSILLSSAITSGMALTGRMHMYDQILFGEKGNEKIEGTNETRRAALVRNLLMKTLPGIMGGAKAGGYANRIIQNLIGGKLGKVLGITGGLLVGSTLAVAVSQRDLIKSFLTRIPFIGKHLKKLPFIGKYFDDEKENTTKDAALYGRRYIGPTDANGNPLTEEDAKNDDYYEDITKSEFYEDYNEKRASFKEFAADIASELKDVLTDIPKTEDRESIVEDISTIEDEIKNYQKEIKNLNKEIQKEKSKPGPTDREKVQSLSTRKTELEGMINTKNLEIKELERELHENIKDSESLNVAIGKIDKWLDSDEGIAYINVYKVHHGITEFSYARAQVAKELLRFSIFGKDILGRIIKSKTKKSFTKIWDVINDLGVRSEDEINDLRLKGLDKEEAKLNEIYKGIGSKKSYVKAKNKSGLNLTIDDIYDLDVYNKNLANYGKYGTLTQRKDESDADYKKRVDLIRGEMSYEDFVLMAKRMQNTRDYFYNYTFKNQDGTEQKIIDILERLTRIEELKANDVGLQGAINRRNAAAEKEAQEDQEEAGTGRGRGKNVHHYSQMSSEFANTSISGSTKISEYGCAIMVAATLLSGLYGDLDSSNIENLVELGEKYQTQNGGIRIDFFDALLKNAGVSVSRIIPSESNPESLAKSIKGTLRKKSGYVIALTSVPSRHYVLMTGLNGNNITVSDPFNKNITETSLGEILGRSEILIRIEGNKEGIKERTTLKDKLKKKVDSLLNPIYKSIAFGRDVYDLGHSFFKAVSNPISTVKSASANIRSNIMRAMGKSDNKNIPLFTTIPSNETYKKYMPNSSEVLNVRVVGGELDLVKLIGAIGVTDKTAFDATLSKIKSDADPEHRAMFASMQRQMSNSSTKSEDADQDNMRETYYLLNKSLKKNEVEAKMASKGNKKGFLGSLLSTFGLGGNDGVGSGGGNGILGGLIAGLGLTPFINKAKNFGKSALTLGAGYRVGEQVFGDGPTRVHSTYRAGKHLVDLLAKTKVGKEALEKLLLKTGNKTLKELLEKTAKKGAEELVPRLKSIIVKILSTVAKFIPGKFKKFAIEVAQKIAEKLSLKLLAKSGAKEAAKIVAWAGPQALITAAVATGLTVHAYFSGKDKAAQIFKISEDKLTESHIESAAISNALIEALSWIPGLGGLCIAVFADPKWVADIIFPYFYEDEKKVLDEMKRREAEAAKEGKTIDWDKKSWFFGLTEREKVERDIKTKEFNEKLKNNPITNNWGNWNKRNQGTTPFKGTPYSAPPKLALSDQVDMSNSPFKNIKFTSDATRNKNAQAAATIIYPIAQKYNIDPNIALAQWAHESAWGTRVKGNNYYGIKGKGTSFRTHEYINGKKVYMNDSFRAYSGLAESTEDYASLISRLYPNTRTQGVMGLMNGKRGSYATDPNYFNKVEALRSQFESAINGGIQSGALATTSNSANSLLSSANLANSSLKESINYATNNAPSAPSLAKEIVNNPETAKAYESFKSGIEGTANLNINTDNPQTNNLLEKVVSLLTSLNQNLTTNKNKNNDYFDSVKHSFGNTFGNPDF